MGAAYPYLENKIAVDRQGPLYSSSHFEELKDPCIVNDGKRWHLFGTGSTGFYDPCQISHASAPSLEGPWKEEEPTRLEGIEGYCVAAPGVIFDGEEGLFHMFIQSTCFHLDGVIYHATSTDGQVFTRRDIALTSRPKSDEAGIYDSHPAVIGGWKYLCYAAMKEVGRPDIYVARSTTNTWNGPWERMGCILRHRDVAHHNQPGTEGYEWGMEGAQLVELPNGSVLLNAVCFLPQGEPGTRQRVFFALAKDVAGPYVSLGPLFEAQGDEWESGENGHASGVVAGGDLHLFYQAQAGQPKAGGSTWQVGHAVIPCVDIVQALRKRDRLRRRLRAVPLYVNRRIHQVRQLVSPLRRNSWFVR